MNAFWHPIHNYNHTKTTTTTGRTLYKIIFLFLFKQRHYLNFLLLLKEKKKSNTFKNFCTATKTQTQLNFTTIREQLKQLLQHNRASYHDCKFIKRAQSINFKQREQEWQKHCSTLLKQCKVHHSLKIEGNKSAINSIELPIIVINIFSYFSKIIFDKKLF